jgi:hypothetical protein
MHPLKWIADALALVVSPPSLLRWPCSCLGRAHPAYGGPSSSRSDAGQIAAAAASFRAEQSEGCPTLSLLEEDGFLSRETREDDAWGNRFHLRCEGEQIVVTSAGPDGVPNNADDLRVEH